MCEVPFPDRFGCFIFNEGDKEKRNFKSWVGDGVEVGLVQGG